MRLNRTRSYRTKSLTWWANDKPQVESLLQALLNRQRVNPEVFCHRDKKVPRYVAAISYYDHGHAEDFHFGRFNPKDGTLHYELDLTRIAAHGRKQRLNCAIEESKKISPHEVSEAERLVPLNEQEYQTLCEIVIRKLH